MAMLLMAVVCACGCGSTVQDSPDLHAHLKLDPSPPVTGPAKVLLTLSDAAGRRLQGAAVRLEGNMNHAGMKPSFADLQEAEPGTYAGTLNFTMGGDWFILVTVTMPDGRRLERKLDVLGVKAT
jgi:hypothetical protein